MIGTKQHASEHQPRAGHRFSALPCAIHHLAEPDPLSCAAHENTSGVQLVPGAIQSFCLDVRLHSESFTEAH